MLLIKFLTTIETLQVEGLHREEVGGVEVGEVLLEVDFRVWDAVAMVVEAVVVVEEDVVLAEGREEDLSERKKSSVCTLANGFLFLSLSL